MVAITNLALFAAAASALVIKRDVSTILANLKTIDTDTNSLTTSVKNWDGNLFGALPIDSAEKTLEKNIQSATTDAQSEAVLSSADSQSVIAYLNNTIAPDTLAALQELESRKSDADSAGITSTIESGLQDLKTDVDALGSALTSISSSDTQSDLQSVVAIIDGYFSTAITDYSS
jgi:Hydrophobic surface binding protein A